MSIDNTCKCATINVG